MPSGDFRLHAKAKTSTETTSAILIMVTIVAPCRMWRAQDCARHIRHGATIVTMMRIALVVSVLVFAFACSRKSPEGMSQLRDEFVYQMLAFSPTTATQAGYH